MDVEIPSPASGRLERILVEPDETVAVGTPLAEIDASARPGEAHREEEAEAEGAETDGPAEPAEADAGQAPAAAPRSDDPDRSRFYSPVVRRIADEHGVDLDAVQGTGIGGRVRKRDLVAHLENGGAASAEQVAPAERPLHTESPYRPDPESAAAPEPRAAPQPAIAGRREPMSPMRRRIAEHMLESRRTSAHCTTIVEVDLAAVVAARAEQKEAMAARGAPLTYLAFVAQATVTALQRHPVLNASIEGDELVYHDDVHLGIAVALESGLIVPVIERAQRLSLEGMAAAIAERAEAARSGSASRRMTSAGAPSRSPTRASSAPCWRRRSSTSRRSRSSTWRRW